MNIHLQIGKDYSEPKSLRDAFREIHAALNLRYIDQKIMQVFDGSYRAVTLSDRRKAKRVSK